MSEKKAAQTTAEKPAKKPRKRVVSLPEPSGIGPSGEVFAKKGERGYVPGKRAEILDEKGIDRSRDLPFNATKVSIFRALMTCGAVSKQDAQPSALIAQTAGVNPKWVRHYCYHGQVSGHTGIVQNSDGKGYLYYLTKKGQRIDLDAKLAERQSKRKRTPEKAAQTASKPAKPTVKAEHKNGSKANGKSEKKPVKPTK